MLSLLLGTMLLGAGSRAEETRASPDAPHDIVHFLHSVTSGEEAKYFSPTISTVNYFDSTLDFSPTEQVSFGQEQFAVQWFMYPAIPASLTVEGIDIVLWINGSAATGLPNFSGSVSVYELSADNITNSETMGTLVYYDNIPSSTTLYENPSVPFIFELAGAHTFAAGSTIRFSISINPGASGSGQYTNVTVHWDEEHRYDSRVIIHALNPMSVEQAWTEDRDGIATNNFLSVPDTSMSFNANVSDPFGCYDVKWVNLTVRNATGTVLPGLDNVTMTRYVGNNVSAYAWYGYDWNYSALSPGLYTFDVWAVDNSGHTFYHYFDLLSYVPYDESLSADFWVGGLPTPIEIRVLDSLSAPLEGATVMLGTSSGTTDIGGYANLTTFNGSFPLRVYWQDIMVHDETLDVSGPASLQREVDVYYPVFALVDDLDSPLEDAVTFIKHPNGTTLEHSWRSDDDGRFSLSRMAGGSYGLSIFWKGVEVFDGYQSVDGNGPFEIWTLVYSVDITVVDELSVGLELAQVVVLNSSTGMVVDSVLTDLEGDATSRLPIGAYDFLVYWRNVLVYDDTVAYMVSSSHHLTLHATIYTVNFTVLDHSGLPLANSQVTVSLDDDSLVLDSRPTNTEGVMSTRLPEGSYNVRVYWQGVLVNATLGLDISGSADITINATVFWVDLTVVDSRNQSLAHAQVTLTHSSGQIFASVITNADGIATVRLAAGNYSALVVWQEVVVLNDTVDIASDDPLILHASVYYLTVEVTGSDNEGVEGAYLIVLRDANAVDSALTGKDGSAEFRLPGESYVVEMSFHTTYYLTEIDVHKEASVDLDSTETLEIKLTDKEYPLPFYMTNLFFVIMALVAIVVGMFLVLYILRRRGSQALEEPSQGSNGIGGEKKTAEENE